eukprot:SAG31_NODE_4167_length_3515_cov_8.114461_3_plen_103_part_00
MRLKRLLSPKIGYIRLLRQPAEDGPTPRLPLLLACVSPSAVASAGACWATTRATAGARYRIFGSVSRASYRLSGAGGARVARDAVRLIISGLTDLRYLATGR